MYIDVVFDLPVDGPFTYYAPQGSSADTALGRRAWAPFGRRRLVGYVVGIVSEPAVKNIKYVYSFIDEKPVVSEELLKTAKWVSEYYFCSWGQAISAAVPPVVRKGQSPPRPCRRGLKQRPAQVSAPMLTPEQKEALEILRRDIEKGAHNVYLLHGVTASGKTEVYLQAIAAAQAKGKSSIALVPEISLTPQAVERFKARFGGIVCVLHSHMTAAERFFEWNRIRDSASTIVVGARSAVFAPVNNLGLIIIDEEHEASYKQEDAPRYHAREVAIKRAVINNAVVLLGSATPSVESYHKAGLGEYKSLSLPRRVGDNGPPPVQIVDMRQYAGRFKKQVILSRPLQEGLKSALDNNEQAILFLNRRGFATYINCIKCGFVLKCRRCNSSMTYHFHQKEAVCHWCGFKQRPPEICPQCSGAYIKYAGVGTQKVESEVGRLFAGVKTNRLDTDSTAKRGSAGAILEGFENGSTQMLIGTQMVAKGHHYPRVTLVGVISADSALHLPDFRSGERTFNLLTQVAGRAGRGQKPGRVVVQTFTPDHYAIVAASRHDYADFFSKEIEFRRQLGLPPFTHLTIVALRSSSQARVISAAERLAGLLKGRGKVSGGDAEVDILGPVPARIPRLGGQHRWNIILKAKHAEGAAGLLRACLADFKKPSGVRVAVDVDPL